MNYPQAIKSLNFLFWSLEEGVSFPAVLQVDGDDVRLKNRHTKGWGSCRTDKRKISSADAAADENIWQTKSKH